MAKNDFFFYKNLDLAHKKWTNNSRIIDCEFFMVTYKKMFLS